MKILVLGSNGMAGHVVTRYLSERHIVKTAARDKADFIVDFEDTWQVRSMFDHVCGLFDVVVNCVGLLVADSIARPDRAIILNGWLPHYIEQRLSDSDTRLIHLSTDCVFDGVDGPYLENSFKSETNSYGRSKSFGEVDNHKDVTLRMSIIGPELKNGTGLLHWFVNNSGSTVNGYYDAHWNGVTTLQLAKCIMQFIERPDVTGIYHCVKNTVSTNKFHLLNTINEIYELNKTVIAVNSPKPANKILIDTRQDLDLAIPDYAQQLKELKEFSIP